MMAAALRRLQRHTPRSLLVRRGYDIAVPTTTSNGVCSSSVQHPDLGFLGFSENAWKWQPKDRYGNGADKYLHTIAGSKSVHPCCNFGAKKSNAQLVLGGVRHESVYDKRMREIRAVRARQRRANQAEDTTTDYSTYDHEDPGQAPLSQPLIGSLKPTSSEEDLLASVLARPDLLVTRNVEWANLAFGFEQQNRYVIMDPRQPQAPVGYILEESNFILRQVMRTRRPFVATIFDGHSNTIFKVRRPAWLINSSIFVEVDGKVIGECHRRWHLWRRIYDIYLGNNQFAVVENPGFWHWTFSLKDSVGGTLAEIDRNFRGFGYEFLTDAGQYVIRFGDIQPSHSQEYIASNEVLHSRGSLFTNTHKHSGVQEMQQLQTAAEQVTTLLSIQCARQYSRLQCMFRIQSVFLFCVLGITSCKARKDKAEPLQVSRILSLSERAVALALAVSLDNDYFSRHSQHGVGLPYLGSE